MGKRLDPIRKKPKEVLDDLLDGARQAALSGAKPAQKFLERTLEAQGSLPNGVKFFAWERLAEFAWQAGDAETCERAVATALAHWDDAHEQFPLELRDALPGLTFLERGIAVRTDRGDYAGALALCDFAVENGFGRHYEAKRENLDWAR